MEVKLLKPGHTCAFQHPFVMWCFRTLHRRRRLSSYDIELPQARMACPSLMHGSGVRCGTASGHRVCWLLPTQKGWARVFRENSLPSNLCVSCCHPSPGQPRDKSLAVVNLASRGLLHSDLSFLSLNACFSPYCHCITVVFWLCPYL